ncbi:MAG: TetR/AcrR family transcriptional regulator [Anaerolineae bacterium]|nr:TetR/AcrR family transcriptional regulator [Anaerolineae bacterium]
MRQQDQQQEVTLQRTARAHRILDAATLLILRWGYDKTNIEDIAKQAGVGKGTIYLHWKTREDLFKMLIKREQLELAKDLRQGISDDPAGATLYGIYKHYTRALIKHPLLKAFLLRDSTVLGKFARGEHSNPAFAARITGFKMYLEFLREYGLVRTDLSVNQQVYMLSAVVMGFYFVEPMMPDEFTPPAEEMSDLIADSVQRTLGANRGTSAQELQRIHLTFMSYLNQAVIAAETQLQQELEN